jgi:AcrR family transcriptional regulator
MQQTRDRSRPVATRSDILAAAIEQIAQHGYDAVRLRDIARAAGVSIGLVQHHFDTREELLGEAFEHHCGRLLDDWRDLSGAELDPWRRIVSLVDRLAESPVLAQRARIWAEFCNSAARRPELRPPLRRIYDAWRSLLAEAVAAGVHARMFSPVLPVQNVVDLLVIQIDGSLLAVAGEVGDIDGRRLHELVIGSAEVLLGLPKDYSSPAPAFAAVRQAR